MTENNLTLTSIEGGDGRPPEPNWKMLYRLAIDRNAASELWRDVVNEMATQQTLAVVNGPSIKRLVMIHVEFERHSRNIAKGGVIRKAKRTKVPWVHLSWPIMKQAAHAATLLEAELGISPRRRNNAGKVQRKERKLSPADRFLKPVSR